MQKIIKHFLSFVHLRDITFILSELAYSAIFDCSKRKSCTFVTRFWYESVSQLMSEAFTKPEKESDKLTQVYNIIEFAICLVTVSRTR